ncbi:4896_t:CDS:2 [Ambispora leptoticha]|uniref:4896_t:CDS:1 n=1 Tax=Ambispora leptoticha TaxID=144679 RepID=A0A9N8ZTC7_9GLOM|nr:4896_t:CDS:2 [Ambispora leptoticha]
MEEPEPINMQPLVSLVKRVSRAFFQNQHIIIMDELTKHDSYGVFFELTRENGNKEGRSTTSSQDVLLYRLASICNGNQMETLPDPSKGTNNEGSLCLNCGKRFAELDIKFLIQDDMTFACDVCHSEIQQNDNANNLKGSEKLHARFMEQSKPIIDLLKDIDNIEIPSYAKDNPGSTSSISILETSNTPGVTNDTSNTNSPGKPQTPQTKHSTNVNTFTHETIYPSPPDYSTSFSAEYSTTEDVLAIQDQSFYNNTNDPYYDISADITEHDFDFFDSNVD